MTTNLVVTKQILVGVQRPTNYFICGYDPYDGCRYPKINFSVYTSYPAGTTFQWYINNVLVANTNSPSWVYNLDPGDCGNNLELSVTATNTCGTSYAGGETVYYACQDGLFSVAPNPVDDELFVTSSDKKTKIKLIEISDRLGNLKKRTVLSVGALSATIRIGELPADIYFIRVFDGKKWSSYKVIKN